LVVVTGVAVLLALAPRGPTAEVVARLQAKAVESAQTGDWATALLCWRRINATSWATGSSHLGEGKATLALGRASQAERALRKAVAAAPEDQEAWLLLLEILRVEERMTDAFELGWKALSSIPRETQPELLRQLTLIALTDLPDSVARATLQRWIDADPDDIDARIALLRRMGTESRSNDPDRAARLARLATILQNNPEHTGAREALLIGLADSGEGEQGRPVLESWPTELRDGRFWRLQGRWDLEFDHRTEEAVSALRQALTDFPQDWRIHYRLARALRIVNRPDEARQEAEAVARIRELLDPTALEPLLDAAFARLPDPAAAEVLARVCKRAGLGRLADSWQSLANDPALRPGNVPGRE
jgi:thioredoxin-like negative regulator of GroEL